MTKGAPIEILSIQRNLLAIWLKISNNLLKLICLQHTPLLGILWVTIMTHTPNVMQIIEVTTKTDS